MKSQQSEFHGNDQGGYAVQQRLYRMRSTDKLFRFQELERQTIYFARPSELNDPIEAVRNTFWKGDQIVWENFFRHYLACIYKLCGAVLLSNDHTHLAVSDLSSHVGVASRRPKPKGPFLDYLNRTRSKSKLKDIIDVLATQDRRLYRDELWFYLQMITATAIVEFGDALGILHPEHGAPMRSAEHPSEDVARLLSEALRLGTPGVFETMIGVCTNQMRSMDLKLKFEMRDESRRDARTNNLERIKLDFSRVFLEDIQTLVFPDWYVACFMKGYVSSSSWSHYADGHKGVCLVFDLPQASGVPILELQRPVRDEAKKEPPKLSLPAHDVMYRDVLEEVDFFRSLGSGTEAQLLGDWYTDVDGNRSECAGHIGTSEESSWKVMYWAKFLRSILTKTREWQDERECRVFLYDGIDDFRSKGSRLLTYDFNTLRGVIFGLHTTEQDKLRVIEIVKKKCAKYGRRDFEFHQAVCRPETGAIESERVLFL